MTTAKQKNLDKDRAALADIEKQKEHRLREERLAQHRAHLQEQLQIRRDYYSLGLAHKLVIFSLFLFLMVFVGFLVLSYFPPTKDRVFQLINTIL